MDDALVETQSEAVDHLIAHVLRGTHQTEEALDAPNEAQKGLVRVSPRRSVGWLRRTAGASSLGRSRQNGSRLKIQSKSLGIAQILLSLLGFSAGSRGR